MPAKLCDGKARVAEDGDIDEKGLDDGIWLSDEVGDSLDLALFMCWISCCGV